MYSSKSFLKILALDYFKKTFLVFAFVSLALFIAQTHIYKETVAITKEVSTELYLKYKKSIND